MAVFPDFCRDACFCTFDDTSIIHLPENCSKHQIKSTPSKNKSKNEKQQANSSPKKLPENSPKRQTKPQSPKKKNKNGEQQAKPSPAKLQQIFPNHQTSSKASKKRKRNAEQQAEQSSMTKSKKVKYETRQQTRLVAPKRSRKRRNAKKISNQEIILDY